MVTSLLRIGCPGHTLSVKVTGNLGNKTWQVNDRPVPHPADRAVASVLDGIL